MDDKSGTICIKQHRDHIGMYDGCAAWCMPNIDPLIIDLHKNVKLHYWYATDTHLALYDIHICLTEVEYTSSTNIVNLARKSLYIMYS